MDNRCRRPVAARPPAGSSSAKNAAGWETTKSYLLGNFYRNCRHMFGNLMTLLAPALFDWRGHINTEQSE
ncbi:hypothetical protein J6590_000567 [Homalodisca vitripennis]|nr:hypothetical protein J6590_000567 [Homalodisca vitripennis]